MAEVTLSTTVDLTLLKMKWGETYVSEGLNRKIVPSQPPGIYQGLRMIQNLGAPRQVELSPDSDTGYHMAVYQSTTGFSLTYWDIAGTSIILDLSSASLDNTDVVVALELTYVVGADTTAVWMAFPLADFNALPASRRDELVILGTVAVPAPATNITTAMISFERTTMSWRNLSKGAISWSQVVRNGDFEQAESNSSNVWHWGLISASPGTGTGTFTVKEGDPARNSKALTLANLTDGTVTYLARQQIAVPVTAGQLGMVKFSKKNLAVAIGGTMNVQLRFVDKDGQTGAGTLAFSIDISAVDASYVEVVEVFLVPTGATALQYVEVFGVPDYAGSPADRLRVDDLGVWLETSGERNNLESGISGDREVVGRLAMRDPDALYSEASVQATYDFSGNQLSFRDQANSGTLGMDVSGSFSAITSLSAGTTISASDKITLGTGLLGTIAAADTPRIVTNASVVAGVEYTLIWRSIPAGQNGARRYVNPNGIIIDTVNAVWDNTTNLWAKDINGEPATRRILDPAIASGSKMETQIAGTNSWADTAWVSEAPLVNGLIDAARQTGGADWVWSFATVPGWAASVATSSTLIVPIPLSEGYEIDQFGVVLSGGTFRSSTWVLVHYFDNAGVLTRTVLGTVSASNALLNTAYVASFTAHTVSLQTGYYAIEGTTGAEVGVTRNLHTCYVRINRL